MELERDATAPMRTAHIVVRGDLKPHLQGFPSSKVESVHGDTHITVRVADPAQLYDILDRLRSLDMILLGLHVDL